MGTARLPCLAGRPPRTARLEAAGVHDGAAAPGSRGAAQGGLAPATVRRIDQRALQAWAAGRPRKPLRSLGVDDIFLGKGTKFLTVVSTLATGEPLGLGLERTRETLDRFFAEALPPARRCAVRAVGVDLGEPFVQSLRAPLPQARIVYDTFHVLRHANRAVDAGRRAEFFRRRTLQALFALNRRLWKASSLKEQLEQPWDYTYERAARRFLTTWLQALRWQRLPAFQALGQLLTRHLDGILRDCHEQVPCGVVEAIHGNIRAMLRLGRGYCDHAYLLLKVQKATADSRRFRMAA